MLQRVGKYVEEVRGLDKGSTGDPEENFRWNGLTGVFERLGVMLLAKPRGIRLF